MSDRRRLALQQRLIGVLGEEEAAVLLDYLPPAGWDELATRTDVQAVATGLRGEMAELRTGLRGEMAELRTELRGEMAELRTELRGEMAELRTGLQGEFRAELAGLRGDLKGEMAAQTRTLLLGMTGTVVAALGTVVALVH